MLLKKIARWFVKDLAIDLGTANTLVAMQEQGVVLQEPSVVSFHHASHALLAAGSEAKRMLGRTPESVDVIRPLRGGVIADFEATSTMLQHFITKVRGRQHLIRPKLIVGVPAGITQVERRAVQESGELIGARAVHLVDETMAAAIGIGLPVMEPQGSLILDIGGGTTEVAVIAIGGVVYSRSVRVAGDAMDEAIMRYIKNKYNLFIGERSAEDIKLAMGTALPDCCPRSLPVRGQDSVTSLPKLITLTSLEVWEALQESIQVIVQTVKAALERTPPELLSDIIDRGLLMTGGGAQLPGLDTVLREATGLPVAVVDKPMLSVVRGTHCLLRNQALLERVEI